MKDELKPCPFCGKIDDIRIEQTGPTFRVTCKNIECAYEFISMSEKQAIWNWNNRDPFIPSNTDVCSECDGVRKIHLSTREDLNLDENGMLKTKDCPSCTGKAHINVMQDIENQNSEEIKPVLHSITGSSEDVIREAFEKGTKIPKNLKYSSANESYVFVDQRHVTRAENIARDYIVMQWIGFSNAYTSASSRIQELKEEITEIMQTNKILSKFNDDLKAENQFLINKNLEFGNQVSGLLETDEKMRAENKALRCCGNCGNNCSSNNGTWVCDKWQPKE